MYRTGQAAALLGESIEVYFPVELRKARALRVLVLVVDGGLVLVAMVLAYLVQDLLRGYFSFLKRPPRFEEYAFLAYLALPLWLLLTRLVGFDRLFERRSSLLSVVGDVLKIDIIGVLLLSLLIFVTKTTSINRSLVGLFVVSWTLLLLVERISLRWWIRYQYRSGQGQLRILLVGAPGQIGERLATLPTVLHPPALVGYVADETEGARESKQLEHLGRVAELEEVLHRTPVDRVLLLPPFETLEAIAPALEICEQLGIPASLAIDHERHALDPPQLERLFGVPLVSFAWRPKNPAAVAFKHGLDVLLAGLMLLLLGPLMVFIALAILLTMGRPIFFAHERAGHRGRLFRMLKFRTMRRGAEAEKEDLAHLNETEGPTFKASRDPRVTALGRLLRKASLDELPQLLHVLTGKMSLVGPRPLPAEEQRAIRGWHRRRLSMRPGITGLWQVSGRSEVTFEEWMQLDLHYVDQWSLLLDLQILLRTIPVVLRGKGAS